MQKFQGNPEDSRFSGINPGIPSHDLGPHSFPTRTLTLAYPTCDWEFKLLWNSATQVINFQAWTSAFSVLWLEEMSTSLPSTREALWFSHFVFNCSLITHSLLLSFSTASIALIKGHPIPLLLVNFLPPVSITSKFLQVEVLTELKPCAGAILVPPISSERGLSASCLADVLVFASSDYWHQPHPSSLSYLGFWHGNQCAGMFFRACSWDRVILWNSRK